MIGLSDCGREGLQSPLAETAGQYQIHNLSPFVMVLGGGEGGEFNRWVHQNTLPWQPAAAPELEIALNGQDNHMKRGKGGGRERLGNEGSEEGRRQERPWRTGYILTTYLHGQARSQ